MASDQLLLTALKNKKVITFNYEGHARECETHIIGYSNGKQQVLCFQLSGGSSRKGIPQWRRFVISNITDLKITENEYDGQRPVPHPHSLGWDKVSAVVK